MGMVEVYVKRICTDCDGKGVIYRPICSLCGKLYSREDEEGFGPTQMMPCGHSAIFLSLHAECRYCAGAGMVQGWMRSGRWNEVGDE